MGEKEDELSFLEVELEDEVAEEVKEAVKEAINEVNKPKERKIYSGKKNFRGLDYISGQEPKHAEMLKMQVRGCIAWLEGVDKMSYKDIVMLPYGGFMDLLRQFGEANQIETSSF